MRKIDYSNLAKHLQSKMVQAAVNLEIETDKHGQTTQAAGHAGALVAIVGISEWCAANLSVDPVAFKREAGIK